MAMTGGVVKPMTKPKTPTLIVRRPVCPACGSPHLRAYKRIKHADGFAVHYCRCAGCGQNVNLNIFWDCYPKSSKEIS